MGGAQFFYQEKLNGQLSHQGVVTRRWAMGDTVKNQRDPG
jgi:hypothetical protein